MNRDDQLDLGGRWIVGSGSTLWWRTVLALHRPTAELQRYVLKLRQGKELGMSKKRSLPFNREQAASLLKSLEKQ